MGLFTGQYERTLDEKNRIQLPSQLRGKIDVDRDGAGLYVTLGAHRGTLSMFTEREFEALASRTETEFMPGEESLRFELQFYGLAGHVDLDKQGRVLLPDRLRAKARLQENVLLVGQKYRIDIWNRADCERAMGIDWESDDWPVNWEKFLRARPINGSERA